jgi:hypothetical protein
MQFLLVAPVQEFSTQLTHSLTNNASATGLTVKGQSIWHNCLQSGNKLWFQWLWLMIQGRRCHGVSGLWGDRVWSVVIFMWRKCVMLICLLTNYYLGAPLHHNKRTSNLPMSKWSVIYEEAGKATYWYAVWIFIRIEIQLSSTLLNINSTVVTGVSERADVSIFETSHTEQSLNPRHFWLHRFLIINCGISSLYSL